MKDLVLLSKTISYALRHRPDEFGITLDPEGWTSLSGLIDALKGRHKFRDVSIPDIEVIAASFEKKRFEVDVPGDRIRAFYGHSVPQKIERKTKTPPEYLYHGTSPHSVRAIMEEGLKPMGRQDVHLSTDLETARKTGRRKHPHPTIIQVWASQASIDGIIFFPGNQDVWLCHHVPPEYLSINE